MWYLIISIVIIVLLLFHMFRQRWSGEDIALVIGGYIGIQIVIFFPMLGFTTGLYEGYSEGTRTGYVTKLSRKGVIYKTYEGEMQLGAGLQASLQEPFKFSVRDKEIVQQLVEAADEGSRVKLHYTQWLIQPYKHGSSSYEIIKVEGD